MKLRPIPKLNSTQPPIFEHYEHPWYKFNKDEKKMAIELVRPNPPSKESVERAKFVDKTYQWRGRDSNIRSGNKRASKQ